MDSVRVTAVPLAVRPGDYVAVADDTDAAGAFSITLQRFTAPAITPTPDTVRVVVSAEVLKRAYRTNGVGPVRRDTILVTLSPSGQVSVPQSVMFSFPPPAP